MKIKDIKAREILDSRSNPTIEVKLFLEDNTYVTSSIPSGASTGSKEALELRDNDERFHGKGVLKAVNNVNNIIKPKLIGEDINLENIDNLLLELDGTENKSTLGANAILGVSLCIIKALAKINNQELYEYLGTGTKMPYPMINIINGGVHADNSLDIQEFMIVPKLATIHDNVRAASEIFITLKSNLKKDGFVTSVGDEGGFAPNLKNNEESFIYLVNAIKDSGYVPGKDVYLAIDVAASELYNAENAKYTLDNKEYTSLELMDYYMDLINKYPIISIEDPFDENDDEAFKLFTEKVGNKIMIVGDDYFVSQSKYLQKGIDNNSCNSILLKANQVGSITEFLETIKLAKNNSYQTVISHRSGETMDTFIADFAVGLSIDYIKTGSVSRGERICKYNRLMEIEDNITNQN